MPASRFRGRWFAAGAIAAAAFALTVAPAAAGSANEADSVTYHRDIAPILERSCQHCHRPESVRRCRC